MAHAVRSPVGVGVATLQGSALVAWYLLIASVLMLFLSRASVAFAAIPTGINFVHFPLAFGAFVLSRGQHRTSAQRAGERVVFISLVLAFAAVVGSPATPALQTALTWAVLVEPILVILTVWNLTTLGLPGRAPRNLALFVVLVQLPIALVQWVLFGRGDDVQGLLVNQGAGHHLLGALGLIAALIALNELFRATSSRRFLSIFILGAGVTLAVIADMRQGVVVFIIATVVIFGPAVLRGSKTASERARRAITIGFLIAVAGAALAASQTLSLASQEPWRGSAVVDSKVEAAAVITNAMSDRPLSLLVGLGGGSTATRVAWLATPLGAKSFLAGLDLPPSPVATRLADLWLGNPQWVRSSASSPFSTWGGVFGDLGLLGLAAYAAMWWLPWRASVGRDDRLETRAIILFVAILGLVGNWMEEPQLMVVAALVVASGTAPPALTSPNRVDPERSQRPAANSLPEPP